MGYVAKVAMITTTVGMRLYQDPGINIFPSLKDVAAKNVVS